MCNWFLRKGTTVKRMTSHNPAVFVSSQTEGERGKDYLGAYLRQGRKEVCLHSSIPSMLLSTETCSMILSVGPRRSLSVMRRWWSRTRHKALPSISCSVNLSTYASYPRWVRKSVTSSTVHRCTGVPCGCEYATTKREGMNCLYSPPCVKMALTHVQERCG